MSDESSGQLRRHAKHCRQMALNLIDDRTITILLTMADEFDCQANELDIEASTGRIPPC